MRNHHISYEVLAKGFEGPREERFYCSGPVIALNEFHRLVQGNREIASDRKTVLRPKLKPTEYRILRVYEKYLDAEGNAVCSDFDLPNTANPDIIESRQELWAARKAEKNPANFFGFYEEAKSEKPGQ